MSYKAEFLLKASLDRQLAEGLRRDPLMKDGFGAKSWGRYLDELDNKPHRLDGKDGTPHAGPYEEGYKPVKRERQRIYWKETYEKYLDWTGGFCKWLKETGKPSRYHSLKDLWKYLPEYMKTRADYIERTSQSAWTYDLEKAALSKALQLPDEYTRQGSGFLPHLTRHYGDIKRTRGEVDPNRMLCHERWDPIIDAASTCGLRRREVRELRGSCITVGKDGYPVIHLEHGTKGGRVRDSRLFGSKEQIESAIKMINAVPATERVWPKLPEHASFHKLRADYANKIYWSVARRAAEVPLEDRVRRTRISRKGKGITEWFDKKALERVTAELGHSRKRHGVAVENYIRGGYSMDDW
jgi:integrase